MSKINDIKGLNEWNKVVIEFVRQNLSRWLNPAMIIQFYKVLDFIMNKGTKNKRYFMGVEKKRVWFDMVEMNMQKLYDIIQYCITSKINMSIHQDRAGEWIIDFVKTDEDGVKLD